MLEPVPLPPCLEVLWDTFRALSRTRPSGFGANPISHLEIRAWCENYGTRLSPWEIDVLLDMDGITLHTVSKKGGSE